MSFQKEGQSAPGQVDDACGKEQGGMAPAPKLTPAFPESQCPR